MNLSIRKIAEKDILQINTIRNESSIWLHNNTKFTADQTLEWFRHNKPDWWVICDEDDQSIAGYFRISSWSNENKNLYIGADIRNELRGKGIGYKAYLSFMEFLFNEKDLNKITLEVLESNKRAYNLYKKIGFVEEGVKRQEVLRDGQWIDSIIMSMLKKEFFVKYDSEYDKIPVHKDM